MSTMNDTFHFSGNYSLLFVLAASAGSLLTHTITDLYNIIEYHMTTVTKNLNVILKLMFHSYDTTQSIYNE